MEPPLQNAVNALRAVPFFSQLNTQELGELSRFLIRRRYTPGQIIFHMDDPGGLLYILESGKVKIYRTNAEGNEAVLAILGKDDFFGELSLIDNHPRSATAETLESTQVYTLQRDEFLRFITNNPEFMIKLLGVLATRIRQNNEQISDVLFLDLPGRLARKLLQLADDHGEERENGLFIPLSLTQTDLAEMTGATRVSVNKALRRFRDNGWVTVANRKFTINDPDSMRDLIFVSGG